jgi:hypothetical protein
MAFVAAVRGTAPLIVNATNLSDLSALITEFGYDDPSPMSIPAELARFREGFFRIEGDLDGIREELRRQRDELAHVRDENSELREKVTRLKHKHEKLRKSICRGSDSDVPRSRSASRLGAASLRPLHRLPKAKSDGMDGIIASLTAECGGNVADRNVVAITCSKPSTDRIHAARNIVDLRSDSCFLSASRFFTGGIPHMRNNWICYDFKNRRVEVTHYAIRTGSGLCHPKSWLLEVSEDGENWEEIDHRDNCTELSGKNRTRIFEVERAGEGRFVRLVNIGKNHYGDDCLALSAWELFGTVRCVLT